MLFGLATFDFQARQVTGDGKDVEVDDVHAMAESQPPPRTSLQKAYGGDAGGRSQPFPASFRRVRGAGRIRQWGPGPARQPRGG